MKAFILIMASVFGLSLQSMAHGFGYSTINSYADAIVFDEMGVTFSVYPDGEFDFYLDNGLQNSSVSNGFVNVTFNSGFNYSPFVQYDDFGAVIQVENVPIWYDHFGRVSQIGDVLISYRDRRLFRVGGLRVFYNNRGFYSHHTGFINTWNPYFVYRPFYVAFVRPRPGFCFVRPNPYRQFYQPIRYTYYRPYVNNVRPAYAAVGHTYRPQGYGRVHARYTQQARRGESPVRRTRRTITTEHAVQRPVALNGTRNVARSNDASNRQTMNIRSNSNRNASVQTRTNASQVHSNRVAAQTSSTRTVHSPSSRSSNTSNVNRGASTKPSVVNSRSNSSYQRGASAQTAVRGSSGMRTVKPSSSSRTQSVNRATSAVKPSSNRSVQPRTTPRSGISQSKMSSKSTSSVDRSNSRSTVSKGSSSSSKSGGKVSVGNRSSKRGQ